MLLLIRRQGGTRRWLQGSLPEARFQDQQGERRGSGGESHLALHGFSSPLGGGSREVWGGHRSGWCRPWGLWEVCTVVTHASDSSSFKNQQVLCEPLHLVCSIFTWGRWPGDYSCRRGGGGCGRRPESRPWCGCACCGSLLTLRMTGSVTWSQHHLWRSKIDWWGSTTSYKRF